MGLHVNHPYATTAYYSAERVVLLCVNASLPAKPDSPVNSTNALVITPDNTYNSFRVRTCTFSVVLLAIPCEFLVTISYREPKFVEFEVFEVRREWSNDFTILSSLRLCGLRGNASVNFPENRFFFGLKFSLNLLEYEAKGFIHEKKKILFNLAFFLRRVGRLSYSTQNFERVLLKTRFFKTARTITRTIFNIFFSNFNHIFQTTF